jgi:hypothetical protein
MRVRYSPRIIKNADQVTRHIVETYFGPTKTLRELCDMLDSEPVDPLRQFSEACYGDVTR